MLKKYHWQEGFSKSSIFNKAETMEKFSYLESFSNTALICFEVNSAANATTF